MFSNSLSQDIMEQITRCTRCGMCVDVCPTYKASHKNTYTPLFRLSVTGKLGNGDTVLSSEEIESLYTCPQCGLCEVICPEGIKVSEIMDCCRRDLVVKGLGPLDQQNNVMEGILKKGNAANGDPDKRWEWLPDAFPTNESDTVFYAGCLSCYLVPASARSSYLVLKKLGVDFMMLKDEDCCGIYFYNAGRWDLAKEKFEENQERFRNRGIRRVITACAGCYYCFKRYYPRLLGQLTFETVHVAEMLPTLIMDKGIEPKKLNRVATYLDPCRLGRKEKVFDPPREILQLCGVEVREMAANRDQASCCGAGAGIRSVYRDLSHQIALQVIEHAPAETLVTSCPFCSFNIKYTARKEQKGKTVTYLTDLVLEALS
ncbi:MAG TPA: (Fe-S)-binding protein [Thermodesulfobacteriota bacterium]|nr:(Fe-S)-binding protein [Thermodesulfobacteriota bacterium]HQO77202.1 (Fe-S)-binding protein [Thermodesulfobacteriota bacterium]